MSGNKKKRKGKKITRLQVWHFKAICRSNFSQIKHNRVTRSPRGQTQPREVNMPTRKPWPAFSKQQPCQKTSHVLKTKGKRGSSLPCDRQTSLLNPFSLSFLLPLAVFSEIFNLGNPCRFHSIWSHVCKPETATEDNVHALIVKMHFGKKHRSRRLP